MRSFLLTLVALSMAFHPSNAGEGTGTLRGVVRDSNGAVIAEARVIIQHWKLDKNNANRLVTSIQPILVTDTKGQFYSQLEPGTYDVFVSYAGLSPFAQKIRIEAGRKTALECELKYDALTDFVE